MAPSWVRCRFNVAGYPNNDRFFVFNGDFIDRGAWGVEIMAILMAWKIALPQQVQCG